MCRGKECRWAASGTLANQSLLALPNSSISTQLSGSTNHGAKSNDDDVKQLMSLCRSARSTLGSSRTPKCSTMGATPILGAIPHIPSRMMTSRLSDFLYLYKMRLPCTLTISQSSGYNPGQSTRTWGQRELAPIGILRCWFVQWWVAIHQAVRAHPGVGKHCDSRAWGRAYLLPGPEPKSNLAVIWGASLQQLHAP